jgi:alpha-tubulin suppressor-like RCC1 family protein
LTNAFAVAGSASASFAARTDGTLIAWGAGPATNIPASATNVVGLSSAGGTVVLRSDGTIIGWNFGTVASIPVPVASNIVSVAAGYNFGFALRAEGTLVGWGNSPYTNFPAGLNHVTAIACGTGHSLALKDDGTVVAWGDGRIALTNVPFNLTSVVGIAAGYSHSLALKANGTVVAWGTGAGTNLPSGLTNVAAIFAGGYPQGQAVSLAIRSNGTVVAWGDNTGFGETNPPAALTNLFSVNGAGAAYHALTVVNDGSPLMIHPPVGLTAFVGRDARLHGDAVGAPPLNYQWLCNGTNVPNATNTTLIFSNVQPASAGNYQLQVSNSMNLTMSLAATLTVVSNTALNFLSQPATQTNFQGSKVALQISVIGNGPLTYQWFFSPTNTSYAPVNGGTNDSLSLDPALAIQSGNYYIAVSNQFSSITSAPVGIKVLFARGWGYLTVSNPPVNLTNAVAIAVGSFGLQGSSSGHYLALKSDGKISSWGTSVYGETNVSALSNFNVTAVAAGFEDSLALRSDGTVSAWGFNGYGQTNVPSGLNNVTAIACGDYHNLALKSDGSIAAWGQNLYGESINSNEPTNAAVAIAAGTYHNLGLRADGTVFGWGNNSYGQITIPAAATNVIAIAAGVYHSLALRANGTVIGWGNNGNGQVTIPAGLSNVVAITAYNNHSTALRADGTVATWGVYYIGSATVPADLANVIAISSGGDHDYGLLGTRAPAFTIQPFSRTVFQGSTSVLFSGKVSGVQPMTYQWRFHGVNISGATNDVLTLTNLQFGHAGSYQLIASNAYGLTLGKSVKLTVTVPLGEAVDATNLSWTVIGSAPWFGQTNITHDGVDAAQSGNIGNTLETILQTTVATNWSGRYTFWWKVSSEQFFDILEFRINGNVQTSISGEVDWQLVSLPVAAGTNVLQWRYSKDASNNGGQDAAWVDQFAFIPDPPVITVQPQPAGQIVNMGTNIVLNVTAAGAPPLRYLWKQNGNLLGGNGSALTLNSVGRAQNGIYFVTVTNAGGSVTSSVVSLKVLVPQLLGSPVLSPGGTFILNSADANGGLLSPADLANFEAQGSADLVNWVTLPNALSLTNGMLQLQDNGGTNWSSRFYRLIEH